jgi:hypothetical protein
MNHMMKSVVLSGALTLCAMLVGCLETSPSQASEPSQSSQSQSLDEIQSPLALPTECNAFCGQAEGAGWVGTGATSAAQCGQRHGQWFPSGSFFKGPPPGCCCVCSLHPPLECE